MTSEQSKELVTATLQAIVKGETEAALANMSDEVSWVFPGNLQGLSGLKRGKQEVKQFIQGIPRAFPSGLTTEIRTVNVAGNTVVVETTNHGKAHNGKDYRNEYCFIFEIESDKIRRIREYVDMLTVKETLLS